MSNASQPNLLVNIKCGGRINVIFKNVFTTNAGCVTMRNYVEDRTLMAVKWQSAMESAVTDRMDYKRFLCKCYIRENKVFAVATLSIKIFKKRLCSKRVSS